MDLQYALRGIRKNPGFAVAIVLTLALGIGANAAIFSVVDRLLFRAPAMLKDPELTHRVYVSSTWRGKEHSQSYIQYARYVDFTNATTSFARTAQVATRKMMVGPGNDGSEMQIGAVTATFFGFFDAPPAAGRYFTTQEDSPPLGAPVTVLSYGLWLTRFGGKPDAIGQTLQIGPIVYTIIGVAPRGFVGLWPSQPPAAWIPISSYAGDMGKRLGLHGEQWWTSYHWTFSEMIAQRKRGVPLERANADLKAAMIRSYTGQLEHDKGMPPIDVMKPSAMAGSILSERGPNESSETKVASWVAGVAIIVWLIACANVANLLLARALRRRREIAVRLALGVTRWRLARQLLAESLLLGVLGGVAGVLIGQWGGALLRAQFLPKGATASVVADPRTLLFAGAAAVVAGFLTGLAPIFQSARVDLTSDLKSGVREGTVHKSRMRTGLLVFQGALSVVLLVGAGLFVRSLQNVRDIRLGYEPDRVLNVSINMRGVDLDSAHQVGLRRDLLETAKAIPGVEHAALAVTLPFWSTWSTTLFVAGIDSVSRLGEFDLNAVSPDYMAVMGTRILRGRGINEGDVDGAPRAVVVSESMAKVLWPHADALGQCLKVQSDTMPCTTVVGIAENIRSENLTAEAPDYFYWLSNAQFAPQQGDIYVRMEDMRPADRETVRRKLQAVMPGASYVTVTPFSDVIGGEMKSWQLGATMFTLFGGLALVLAAIGLYSVIAYNVAQRTHELGVRVALGATVRDVVRLVLSEGVRVAAIGVALGCAIALGLSKFLAPLLFKETPRDPVVYLCVVGVLLGVAVVASLVPARRAGRVDPMQALRVD